MKSNKKSQPKGKSQQPEKQVVEEEELPGYYIDRENLDFCKYKGCQQKDFGPHKHYLKQCQEHKFCEMEKSVNIIDVENGMTFPLAEKGPGLRQHAMRMLEAQDIQKLKDNQKILADEYSVDHWYAQTFGLDINKMPAYRPPHIQDKRVFAYLKSRYKAPLSSGQEKKTTEEEEEGVKSTQGKTDKENGITDPSQLKPMVYPKCKKVETLLDRYLEDSGLQEIKENLTRELSQRQFQENSHSQTHQQQEENQEQKKMEVNASSQKIETQKDRPINRSNNIEREISHRYKSPYINQILPRKDVQSCLSKIKEYKLKMQQDREELQKKVVQTQEPVHPEDPVIQKVGQAKFINFKVRKHCSVQSSGTMQAQSLSSSRSQNTNSTVPQKGLTTFQKLQLLRQKKLPMQQMMMQQATQKPLNHFDDIQKQKLQDFYQASQDQNQTTVNQSKFSIAPHGESEISESPIESRDQKYVSLPQNKQKFETFLNKYEGKKLQQIPSPDYSCMEESGQVSILQMQQIYPHLQLNIDKKNQRLATEYNSSILSPSINQKKDNLMRSLKKWPQKYARAERRSISWQVQDSSQVVDKYKSYGELQDLVRSALDPGISQEKQEETPSSVQEKHRNKRVLELSQKPRIRIENFTWQEESGNDDKLKKILGRIHIGHKCNESTLSGTFSPTTLAGTSLAKEELQRKSIIASFGATNTNFHSRYRNFSNIGSPRSVTIFSPQTSKYQIIQGNERAKSYLQNQVQGFTIENIPQSKSGLGVVSTSPIFQERSNSPPSAIVNHRMNSISFVNIEDQGQSKSPIKPVIDLKSSKNQTLSSQRASLCPVQIKRNDIEVELPEPAMQELDRSNQQVNVILDLVMPDRNQIDTNVFECAEYWLSKGYQAQTGTSYLQALQGNSKSKKQQRADQSDQALDFYYQGVGKNPSHYGCCYNIGATFLNKGKNRNAQKWFRFARQIQPESKEPYLGEAIAAFKLGEIEECSRVLHSRPGQRQVTSKKKKADSSKVESSESESIKEKSEEKPVDQEEEVEEAPPTSFIVLVKLDIENQFSFLQTICYKKCMKFEKAQREYRKLEPIFQQRQGFLLAKYVFTNLMLPMQINRKVVEDYVQSFLDSVAVTDESAFWDQALNDPLNQILQYEKGARYNQSLYQRERIWTNVDRAILYLRDMPLFKRFMRTMPMKQLKKLIPELRVVDRNAGDIIFNEPNDLFIVLNGRVVLRYHKEDPLEYQYIAQYTPGKVIGHDTLDAGMSKMGQVFPIVVSHKCVLLKVNKKVFNEQIWKACKTQSTEIKIRALRQYSFVEELCDQTLYDIMYEQGKVMLFKTGQLVLRCHPRSPLNPEGRKLYDQEYGSHMKAEANQSAQKSTGSEITPEQSLVKASAFGSFFAMVNQKKRHREKMGITEEMYINMHKKPIIYRKGNYPESSTRSLVLILEGSAIVKNSADGFESFELRTGDHFGASDLLHIPDIEYLGDIIAGEKGLKCMVIPKPEQVVQLWERKILQEKLKDKLNTLKIMVENKYSFNKGVFSTY